MGRENKPICRVGISPEVLPIRVEGTNMIALP